MMKRHFIWVAICVCLVIVVPSGSFAQSSKGSIKFGTVLALTGTIAATGAETKRGMLTAVDEVNKGWGGVNGRPIEIVFEDDANVKTQATAVFRKLAEEKDILAITLSSTGCSMAMSPLCERYRIAGISPWSIGSWPGGFNDWTFRNTIPDTVMVPELLKAAKEKFGIKRAAMMFDYTDDWSVQGVPIFRDACKNAGIEVALPPQSYARGDTDYSAQLTKIKAANVDGIFMPAQVQEGSLIVSQSRKLGITARFLGTSGYISTQGLGQAGEAADGTLAMLAFHPGSKKAAWVNFHNRFKKLYPNEKVHSYCDVCGYDVVLLLADSAKRAKIVPPITPEKRKALRDALASTAGFEGATGVFNYKGSGDALSRPGVLVTFDAKSGDFKAVE